MKVYHEMSKHKRNRELLPVRIYENGEVRVHVDTEHSHLWHNVTDEGLEFRCKCPRLTHVLSWFEDIPRLMLILGHHQDELWNFLCDQQRLVLVGPLAHYKAEHPTTRLVSVIWPTDGVLTFVS